MRRLGVPPDAVDDAAQEVFVVASRKLESIELGKETAFLFGTATGSRPMRGARCCAAVWHPPTSRPSWSTARRRSTSWSIRSARGSRSTPGRRARAWRAWVSSNAQLRSFSGLSKMAEVGGGLTVTSNPLLPKPTSQAFAKRLTIRGALTIN